MAFYRGTSAGESLDCGSANDTYFGMKGNDTINGLAGDDVLYGGAGNDVLNGGEGDDVIFGDIGNDVITGGEDDDAMHGGIGNDTFVFADGDGQDTVDGDQGTDTMDYSDLTSSEFMLVAGSSNLEMYVGTTSLGEAHDMEKVIATDGDTDTLDGSGDTNGFTVDLSKALQTVSGLLALKQLVGFENVIGGSGNDTITGSSGNNVIDGGEGNDLVYASGGEGDEYEGGDGDDTLSFSGKSFTSKDGVTLDVAEGELTYSSLTVTFSGFEYLVGSKSKADVIDASEVASHGVVIDMSTTTGSASMGSGAASNLGDLAGITGFEIVYGGGGDDAITGDKGNNTIEGNGGDDTLAGGLGNDLFNEGDGETGSDEIDGGVGNDIVNYGTNTSEYVFNLGDGTMTVASGVMDTLTGIETITLGGTFAGDTFDASDATAALNFTLKTGKISGIAKTEANVLKSVTGFEHAKGGSGNDKLLAGDSSSAAVANSLEGGGGADSLDGGFGNDTLDGGAGADTLVGGLGDDEMYGGADNDKLTDKEGNDTYAPLNAEEAAAFGTDTIVDLKGTDTLDLGLWNEVTFDLVDGSTDKDTNKFDALKITTDDGVIIIDGFFDNSLTVNDDLHEVAANLFKAGAGCIETIMVGSTEMDFDAIVEALTASA